MKITKVVKKKKERQTDRYREREREREIANALEIDTLKIEMIYFFMMNISY